MIDHVLTLLDEKKYIEIRQIIKDMNAVDIAEVFEELRQKDGRDKSLRLFRLMPKELAAESFAYMDSDVQQGILEAITDNELKYILDDLYLDDFVDMVEEMPANVVKRVLDNAGTKNRQLINQYLQYPDDSAGSIMTNEYVYFKSTLTVAQAFNVIRRTGVNKETIYTCYVIDAERKLMGVVTVRDLLLADPDAMVGDIMSTNAILAHTLDDKEEVANLLSRYDMLALPVVDKEERLVGIITIDDAVDVIQEENTEDFEKMAGMAPSEDSYLKTPVVRLAQNRIVWLLILMLSATITGALLEHYQAAIATIPLLVSFIPMLMDTGGNCGSQTSTMIIRGIALSEIGLSDFLKVWFKEIRVALLCGLGLSVINFARIWIQYGDMGVALTVSLTLLATVCISKSLGCILPMFAKRFKFDPAIMASPLITTITDAASILVFFTLATLILTGRL